MALTIFYDGSCPLCCFEIKHLQKRDHDQRLSFEDITAPEFSQRYPSLDWYSLNERIHAFDSQGNCFIGLDATYEAWRLVGRGWLYAPTRWPVIRFFADKCYLLFAKHRYRISYWLTGQARTKPSCNVCDISKFERKKR